MKYVLVTYWSGASTPDTTSDNDTFTCGPTEIN